MIFLTHINVPVRLAHYFSLMKLDLKFISLAGLLLVLGFGGGYLLQKAPQPDYLNADISLQPNSDCELNQAPCTRVLEGAESIRFSIEPRPIYGVSPLVFQLNTEGLEVQNAMVELSGTEMNMGSYRFDFEASGPNELKVDGTLPVCIRNQMEWRADVWLQTKQRGLIKVPYIFTAAKK